MSRAASILISLVIMLCILVIVWWEKPTLGIRLCTIKGLMRDVDFVEELRPAIISNVSYYLRYRIRSKKLPLDFDHAQVVKNLNYAIDDFRECVKQRGLEYCRYVGSNNNGQVIMGRTVDGPNAVEAEDEHLYRYIVKDRPYEFAIIPRNHGPSEATFNNFGAHEYSTIVDICNLGCWCNAAFGREAVNSD